VGRSNGSTTDRDQAWLGRNPRSVLESGRCPAATRESDGHARVYDTNTGQKLVEFKGHSEVIVCLAWNPDGNRLATGSDDGPARVWDIRTGRQLAELNVQLPKGLGETFNSSQAVTVWNGLYDVNTSGVRSLSWSPDGSRLATGSIDQVARVWDASSGMHLMDLK
jgi:WD40 repeat protein